MGRREYEKEIALLVGEKVNENEIAVLDFTLYFSVPHEDRQT